ncbi:MAG: bifunctional 4-hydroxy-2-oxoglutarate aldolase/2-dehydro-3-deoxy-phosphogluconate aldolase [Bdellovibrionales bacterium]
MSDKPSNLRRAIDKPLAPSTEPQLRRMLLQSPIIPLAKINEPETFAPMARGSIEAAPAGTVPSIEILYRDHDAIGAGNEEVLRITEDPEFKGKVNVFAGSILCPDDVDLAVNAGFDGLISGGLSRRVIERANTLGIPYLPAVQTLDEMKYAHETLGLSVLKLFPARGTADQSKADAGVMAPLARLKNMGVNLYASDDTGAPENSVTAKTATEALQFFEEGQKHIRIEAVNSEPEWDAMMRYAAENNIQLCCTGGVKLENIYEFSAQPAVIGVGASSILASARMHDGDLDEGVALAVEEMNAAWIESQQDLLAEPDEDRPGGTDIDG